MPFTLSHPAAVLPLMRRPFVPAALVAGAVAPDVPYFFKVPVTAESWYEPLVNATFSHSLWGMLVVGMPVTVVLVAVMYLVWPPLYDLVPLRMTSAVAVKRLPRAWYVFAAWFLISVAIGLFSHYAWDSLTDAGGWAMTYIPSLDQVQVGGLSADRILQHASSALGMAVIAFWCVKRYRSQQVTVERMPVSRSWKVKRLALVVGLVVATAAFSAVSLNRAMARDSSLNLEAALSRLVTSGLAFALVAVVIYAVCWQLAAKFARPGRAVRTG